MEEQIDIFIWNEYANTRFGLWKHLVERRLWLIMCATKSFDDFMWDAILGNVKPRDRGYEKNQVLKSLKSFNVTEQELKAWMIELAYWDWNRPSVIDLEKKKRIYCAIRKNFLPISNLGKFINKQRKRGQELKMNILRDRAAYYIQKELLNMKDKVFGQVSDEDILDEIELVHTLCDIRFKIEGKFEDEADPVDDVDLSMLFLAISLNELIKKCLIARHEEIRAGLSYCQNERFEEFENSNAVWLKTEKISIDYWFTFSLNLCMQNINNDWQEFVTKK
jgi:hypothetical protein